MSSTAKYIPPHRRREADRNSARSHRSSNPSTTSSWTPARATASPSPADASDKISMKVQSLAFDTRTKNPVFLLSNCAPIQGRPTSSLFVFGDSFIGPFKLIKEHIAYKTYPGASAKGLNNPKSTKEVSKELLPILSQILASRPPEQHDIPVTPVDQRYTILMFGNVDLQINYLWQLENRVISELSFSQSELAACPSFKKTYTTAKDLLSGENTEATDIPKDDLDSIRDLTISDPCSTPPGTVALGPELFVESVIKNYTEWLDREIVQGPIGKEARRREEEANILSSSSSSPASSTTSQDTAASQPTAPRLLIAAALPPMVPDDALSRIPEKYTQQHLPEICRAPTPESSRPQSPSSSSSPPPPPADDASPSPSPSPSSPSSSSTKLQTVDALLGQKPALCDLAVRVRMTNTFNTRLREFCDRYPTLFAFVDIGPAMHASTPAYVSACGEVDRSSWADKLDKTNVHPLWEPTISLWQKELATVVGIPGCESWELKEDPKETLKKYEGQKQGVLDRFARDRRGSGGFRGGSSGNRAAE